MIDVITPKKISPDCPFKSSQRPVKYIQFRLRGVSLKFEYLGKIEKEFENTLAWLSGAQMGLINEKLVVKNLVTQSH